MNRGATECDTEKKKLFESEDVVLFACARLKPHWLHDMLWVLMYTCCAEKIRSVQSLNGEK